MPGADDGAVVKPGVACIGCRRRKLKCSKEPQGCSHCIRSDLPCVYPKPEVGVKRKRGPYKKDKPAREKHLEDLVRYLDPRKDGDRHESSHTQSTRVVGDHASGPLAAALLPDDSRSDTLVKDALDALTNTVTQTAGLINDHVAHAHTSIKTRANSQHGSKSPHPPIWRIFEYWHIFVLRVDPVTKIVHCPTVSRVLTENIENINSGTVTVSLNTLLNSIYYAAISTCTVGECRRRFSEERLDLLQRYGQAIETALANHYENPPLEMLQGLVLYITCLRRQDDGSSLRALFSLAVRSAQLIGLHEEPSGKLSWYDIQMRRRLWWHICGLENRGAEDANSREVTVMQTHDVQFPGNLSDIDLNPQLTDAVKEREGATDMFFSLLRMEIQRLHYRLIKIRKRHLELFRESENADHLKEHQRALFSQTKAELDKKYLSHLDESRAYDWLCINFVNGMLMKAELMIDHPFGAIPTRTMPVEQRMMMLRVSVEVIKLTHLGAHDSRASQWGWFFRGYNQWHSLSIIIAELSWNQDQPIAGEAWSVLDIVLKDWDKIYERRRGESAWDHVNASIERTRDLRRSRNTAHESDVPQMQSHGVLAGTSSTSGAARVGIYVIDPRSEQVAEDMLGESASKDVSQLNGDDEHKPDCVQAYSELVAENLPSLSMEDFDFDFDFTAFDTVFGNDIWSSEWDDINTITF